MLCKTLENPLVNIIGHCDRLKNGFNIDKVLDVVKSKNKIIELNYSSLNLGFEAEEKIIELATLCMEKEIYVSIGSDAHIAHEIDNFTKMESLANYVKLPSGLIVTNNLGTFVNKLNI